MIKDIREIDTKIEIDVSHSADRQSDTVSEFVSSF